MYKIEVRAKARQKLNRLDPTTRRITTNRIAEIRRLGPAASDGTISDRGKDYFWAATSVSFIIYDVVGGKVVIIYTVAARSMR